MFSAAGCTTEPSNGTIVGTWTGPWQGTDKQVSIQGTATVVVSEDLGNITVSYIFLYEDKRTLFNSTATDVELPDSLGGQSIVFDATFLNAVHGFDFIYYQDIGEMNLSVFSTDRELNIDGTLQGS